MADEELTCSAFDYYQRCVFKNVKINAQGLTPEQKVKAVELLCNYNDIPANIMRRVNEHKDAWNEYYAAMLRNVVENKIISLADIVAWGLAAVDHAQKDDNNIQQAVAEYFTAYMQGKAAEKKFDTNEFGM